MRKFSILLSTVTSLLLANETVEVMAQKVAATSEIFYAYDDVVILYEGAMLQADSATYDKNSSLLTLEGDVEVLGIEYNQLTTDKLIINTSNKSVHFKEMFISGEEHLWINSTGGTKKGEKYTLFDSRVSSCNVDNPDWTIDFKKADYYRTKEFMTMKDAKIRFYDTTIFYFPYLAFSTVHKRTTGLLLPRFKASDTEGFLYEQPFFYAPTHNWDVEFNPQIRANRGLGSHVTARFVDSNHSNGYVRTGYFQNNQHYADTYNLNREHLGLELFYNSSDILPQSIKSMGYQSGFYVDAIHLNDREYINLQKEKASTLVQSNLIESRLNAFIYDERNYLGLYGRYNIDTSKTRNDTTIQEIPSLQYHRSFNQIFTTPFFYTFDGRMRNYTRMQGSQAYQGELNFPVTYIDSFFNDYLDLSASENLYLTRVNFRDLAEEGEDYYYYRNFHTIEFSSDLNKAYGNSVHTLHPSITYVKPSFERESRMHYSQLSAEQQELFLDQTNQEQLSVALSQYLYDADWDMNIFHKLGYTTYPDRVESQGDMINEMGYQRSDIGLYSNLVYSWDVEELRSLTSQFRYNQSNYDIMLTHFYNNDFLFDDKKTSFIDTQLSYRYNDKESWFGSIDYDMDRNFNHKWALGWRHSQSCWSAVVSVGQETIPNRDDSFRNTALYFELNLNPLGGIQQNIENDFSSQQGSE